MPTTALHYQNNTVPTDASDVNQFVDVLTGVTGSTGITVTSLAVNSNAVTFIGSSIPFTALGGTSLVIGPGSSNTGTNPDQITLSSGAAASNAVTIAATAGAGADATIDIVLTPLSTGGGTSVEAGVVNFNYATITNGTGSTATLGAVGGTARPTTAAMNSWLQVKVAGTTSWIPIWR